MSANLHAIGRSFWGRSLVAVEWRKLCYVSYAVDPAQLGAQLPPGVSLDLRDERAMVSLVLWETLYPSVLGFTLPKQPVSTEVALRYHVREGARRGVVTVREDSSSPLAALAARALLREPTRSGTVRSNIRSENGHVVCEYEIVRDGRQHKVSVRADKHAERPARETLPYFLEQRPYGYARDGRGELLRYDLDHPLWDTYEVLEHRVDVDYGALYGSAWSYLTQLAPSSVILAEGSTVRASLPE